MIFLKTQILVMKLMNVERMRMYFFSMNDGISKELNESITEDVIRNIVRHLSNKKAGGYDRILDAYIQYTIGQCIHIYVKLLNLVIDSGFFPECWTVGNIKPM
jgi:hypothetical protein